MISMTHPSRNVFVLSLFGVFMPVCMAKSAGFESLVNKDFKKENDVIIQMEKLKIILYDNDFTLIFNIYFYESCSSSNLK
jgi:hypothetical protein